MTRKDGLTNIQMVYWSSCSQGKERKSEEVLIKALYFEDPYNDEYNNVETDFKENLNTAK